MRLLAFIAFTALALPPVADPTGGFRFQRRITPPANSPAEPACIILDAAVFRSAEPGLRDLRLFQDGTELPYAVEESFDKRAFEHDTTPADDRSLYQPSAPLAVAQPTLGTGKWPGIPPERLRPSSAHIDLPAKVPVERIRLLPAPSAKTVLTLQASPLEPQPRTGPKPIEQAHAELDAAHPNFALTLGANLQNPAAVDINLLGAEPGTTVLLEMRRRSLCYQPRSASAPVLLLGNPALPAPQYDYVRHFSPDTRLPLATLGPLTQNPAFQPPEPTSVLRSRHAQWQLAILISGSIFLLSTTHFLNGKKGPLR